jgi:anti-sigma regulatory factor (Ser/Thr protein kinase)
MTWAGRAAGGDGGEALHALVLYDSEESLCARAVPYLRGGLDRGEAVLAVVSAGVQQILRSALGYDATRVRWQADDVSYRRLGAMFEGFRRFLADQRAAGVGMRLLAQNDTIGAPERMAAYVRFEAMANEVYRPYGYRWACLYDTRDYSAQTLRQVRQVHPQLLQPGGRARSNGQYLEPSRYVTQAEPLPRPPAAVQLDFEVTDPGELPWGRRLLRGWAEIRGMGREDADDVVIAIGEAVTNAVEHGTPPVRVRAWTADGLARVRVHDQGTTPIPATAGYRRPTHEFDRGYGLWVARQLADVVTTYSDRAGTTIALDFPLAPRR